MDVSVFSSGPRMYAEPAGLDPWEPREPLASAVEVRPGRWHIKVGARVVARRRRRSAARRALVKAAGKAGGA